MMEVSKTNKNKIALIVGIIACILVTASVTYYLTATKIINEKGEIPISFTVGSIHATITIYKGEQKILEQYHAGAVTKLGLNVTLCKLTGYGTSYNLTQYTLNCTFVSIGNQGTLNTDSVVLPGEWNRTTGSLHDCTYNSFNITATFYPDASGPYTADCLGLNYQDGIGNNALWGYDTFTEVTGIDETFTITIEIRVSAS